MLLILQKHLVITLLSLLILLNNFTKVFSLLLKVEVDVVSEQLEKLPLIAFSLMRYYYVGKHTHIEATVESLNGLFYCKSNS